MLYNVYIGTNETTIAHMRSVVDGMFIPTSTFAPCSMRPLLTLKKIAGR